MNGLTQRLGASLRRAPYVWLVATVLTMLLMDSVLRMTADESDSHNPWIALGGIVAAIYSVVLWFFLPRYLQRQAHVSYVDERVALTRWAFAFSPYLLCYSAVLAGASPWTWALGYLTTIALLVASARRTSREVRVTPSN